MKFEKNKIFIDKELSDLDKFTLDFIKSQSKIDISGQ